MTGEARSLAGVLRDNEAAKQAEQTAIAHLDFRIRCDIRDIRTQLGEVVERGARCAADADWLATCNDCGAQTYACDAHKEARKVIVSWCGSCGHSGGPLLFSFTRIGGAA